jgi:hypothetical protein
MSRVGCELRIPAFEQSKAVHALDRVVTVIGNEDHNVNNHSSENLKSLRPYVMFGMVELYVHYPILHGVVLK